MEEMNELRDNIAKVEAEKESHRLEANRLGMRAVGLERQLRTFEKDYKTKWVLLSLIRPAALYIVKEPRFVFNWSCDCCIPMTVYYGCFPSTFVY